MKYDLTTIGEGQIRLTCPKGEHLVSARALQMTAACSEANVAGLLAQLGKKTAWCTVLPKGGLSERVLSEFRSAGIDLSNVVMRKEGRVALYFLEPGEMPLPGKVTYDRLHTPFRDIEIEDVNWDDMLDTKMVFVTGITAALTEKTAKVLTYFVDQAYERKIKVALDVNYRSLLWDGDQARKVLEPIARKSSIVFCSRRDAGSVFGLKGSGPQVCHDLREFLEVPVVVSTDQLDGTYSSTAEGEKVYEVERVPVVDRPGAGDSFVGGTLYGYLNGDVNAGVRIGMRTAKIALTHHGDLTRISHGELETADNSDILR